MGLFNRNQHKAKKQMRMDFMDYESKGLTPQRFGDTAPQLVMSNIDRYDKYDRQMHLFKTNAIAHRIAAMQAEAATRNYWRLIMDDQDKQKVYQKGMDDLNLQAKITQEIIYRNVNGGSYLNVNVDEKDQTNLATPLNPHNILKVKSVNAFGLKHVQKTQICNDPTDDNYLKEDYITLDGLTDGGDEFGKEKDSIKIDHTRYQHISLDKFEDDAVGTSLLERCYDQLKVLDTAEYSLGKMLYEYNLKVINSDAYFNGSEAKQERDKRMLKEGMSTESVVVVGLDEDVKKVSTSAGGIQSLYDFAWQQLSTATGIPKSVLLGEQAGTLAGASQDVINYYETVKAMQEQVIRPQLEWIVRLLMWSEDCGDKSEDPDSLDWHIEFNPLFSQDANTKTKNFVNLANGLKTLTDAGIMGTDEAHDILVSKSNDASIPLELQADSAEDYPQLSKTDVDNYKKEKKQIEKDIKKASNHGKKT